MIRLTVLEPGVDREAADFEDLVAAELARVASRVARRMERSARALAASAAPPASPLTAQGGGEPFMNIDDLVLVGTEWAAVVDGRLRPILEQTYLGVHAAWSAAVNENLPGWGTAVIPPVSDQLAEVRLAAAENRLRGIGDDLWRDARETLLDGFKDGESIAQLADRVRSAAGVTAPRARLIARTEVISVSNGASLDTARQLGVEMQKQWMATLDDRVRESHEEADGQLRALNEPFEVGGAELDHPGDPSGPVEEIANCRCTVGWVFPDDPPPPEQLLPGESMSLTAAARPHTGAMIALVPSDQHATRLAVEGGEDARELHLTLVYLGEAADLGPDNWTQIRKLVTEQMDGIGVVTGGAFALSAFNPGTASDQETALVLGVDGAAVQDAYDRTRAALSGFDGQLREQHMPWVAHVTLAYSDDLAQLGQLVDRLGEVSFDRIRFAYAGEYVDVPLSGAAPSPPGGAAPPGGQSTGAEADTLAAQTPVDTAPAAAEAASVETVTVEAEHATEATVTLQVHPAEPCPPGQHQMPDGTCMDDDAMGAEQPVEHFHAVMIIEGVSTGFRTFAEGALSWREPPFAFRWQTVEPEMGGHGMAVHVGNIARVERIGNEIHGWGPLDLDSADGLEFGRKLASGFAPWVSIGLDEELHSSDVELVYPSDDDDADAGPDGDDDDGDLFELLFQEPEQLIFHAGRIAELTAVTVPAQQEARVEALPALSEALRQRGVPITAAAHTLTLRAVGTHATDTGDGPWDGPANEARLPAPMPLDTARGAYAWIEPGRAEDGEVPKDACRFIHHEVAAAGQPGAANLTACSAGIGVLNGGRGGTNIPDEDRQGVYDHLAAHLRDADQEPPPLMSVGGGGPEMTVVASAWTVTLPELPPRWWFEEPDDVDAFEVGVTITDEGRIFGFLAPEGVAHRGFRDRRVEVPMGKVDYSRWMGGAAMTEDGLVPAGPVTMDCPHLSPHATSDTGRRMEHYEHTCSVVAKAAVGEKPGRGVWFAGALEPGVSGEQLSKMLACRLSGDWAPHQERKGWQELVAALFVPVPGFARGADGRTRASVRVADGVLTASAVPVRFRRQNRLRPTMERLAKSIGRDRHSRARQLRARVYREEVK